MSPFARRGLRASLISAVAVAGMSTAFAADGPIFPSGAAWQELSAAGRFFSEGVVAGKDGRLYVSDMTPSVVFKENNPGGTIYRYDPAAKSIETLMQPSGMANGLHIDKRGDLIIAQTADTPSTGGRAIVRRNVATNAMTVLADSYDGKRLVGPNDVTSDSTGRIYFADARYGGIEPMELPNAVYRIDLDGKVVQLATDILRPNGIEVSPDGHKLYVASFNSQRLRTNPAGPSADRFGLVMGGVVAYELDPAGGISNGRVLYRNDELGVDGMAVDTEGNLYLATHNGNPQDPKGHVVVVSPEGAQIAEMDLPQNFIPSNLGFGRGPDASTLYMTTAFKWRLYSIPTNKRGHYFD
jgi:gluconolactonase